MKTSQKGKDLIVYFEGVRLNSYYCPAGVLTIGIGHTGPDVFEGQVITREQAFEMLEKDLIIYENAVNNLSLPFTLNQNQFDALVSFAYNCGCYTLLDFSGCYPNEISANLPLYCHDIHHNKLIGLYNRRIAEQKLFNEIVSRETMPQYYFNGIARKGDHVKLLKGAYFGVGENHSEPTQITNVDDLNKKDLIVDKIQMNLASHECLIYYSDDEKTISGAFWTPINCIYIDKKSNIHEGDEIKILQGAYYGKSPNNYQPSPIRNINDLNKKSLKVAEIKINHNSHECNVYYSDDEKTISGALWIPINCITRL